MRSLPVAVLMMLFYATLKLSQCVADPPAAQKENSASRLLFWVGARDVAALTDAQLDAWKAQGVGGFFCMTRTLPGMGGTAWFTGDPGADLSSKEYELQRAFRDSRVVQRARERGMKMYLGCHLVNYYNTATPLKDWFDDAGWAEVVLPRMRDLAAAAKLLGFDGITYDEELYPQKGRVTTATWEWNYPGNTHTEAEVRAKARQRGSELMRAVLDGYPSAQIVVYHYDFPSTWRDVVHERVNHKTNVADPLLFIDFWDGMSSVEGYGAIRFINAVFYKTPHVGRNWDAALQYDMNSFYSLLSRRLSNWEYASSRIFQSPFSWISAGPSKGAYDDARPPEAVARQLQAFAKWGMGGEIANFCYGGLNGFDYTPYATAMQAVSKLAVVDAEPPRLEITSPASADEHETKGRTLDLEGIATDNLAIRAIRWTNDRGGSGAAKMTWQIKSQDEKKGYEWQMNWSITGIALQPGVNQIELTAEDIKGLTAMETLTVEAK